MATPPIVSPNNVLQLESLEAVMRNVTFDMSNLRMWGSRWTVTQWSLVYFLQKLGVRSAKW